MAANLTVILLTIGLVFLFAGLLLKIFPPKKINSIYGYRTFASKRNIDTWKSANQYAAILMIWEGIALSIIGFVTLLFPDSGTIGVVIAFGSVISFIILLIIATEKHLNKIFDKDGQFKIW